MEEKKNTIEEDLKEIDGIIGKLESRNLTLEESLKEFEKGVGLIRTSSEILGEAEKKLKCLAEDGTVHDF